MVRSGTRTYQGTRYDLVPSSIRYISGDAETVPLAASLNANSFVTTNDDTAFEASYAGSSADSENGSDRFPNEARNAHPSADAPAGTNATRVKELSFELFASGLQEILDKQRESIIDQLQSRVNAKIIDRLSAPSDTMTMESNAILRKAASNFDALHQQLNQVFENQRTCQGKVAELQRDFMKAEQDISVQREREAALRSKRLQLSTQAVALQSEMRTADDEEAWREAHDDEIVAVATSTS